MIFVLKLCKLNITNAIVFGHRKICDNGIKESDCLEFTTWNGALTISRREWQRCEIGQLNKAIYFCYKIALSLMLAAQKISTLIWIITLFEESSWRQTLLSTFFTTINNRKDTSIYLNNLLNLHSIHKFKFVFWN